MELKIDIEIHELHVTTTVTKYYEKRGDTFDSYTRFGANKPYEYVFSKSFDDIKEDLLMCKSEDRNFNREYLEGFMGYFELVLEYKDAYNLEDFEVLEARYIQPKFGGKDVTGAFYAMKGQFKEQMVKNLLNTLREKDVPKLTVILNAIKQAV